MRALMWMMIVMLITAGLMMYCHREDITKVRDDYQAY